MIEQHPYHAGAIRKGLPMFGPTDVGTGSFERWLEAHAGEAGIAEFEKAMTSMSKDWHKAAGDRGASGQRALMLERFTFPDYVVESMRRIP